jgi:hypothetical protein
VRSATLPSFWDAYHPLAEDVKAAARKTYRLWLQNPFHPSLHFKCVNREDDVWSVRVTRACRALGVLDGDTVTWFWIGGHDEYERCLP